MILPELNIDMGEQAPKVTEADAAENEARYAEARRLRVHVTIIATCGSNCLGNRVGPSAAE